MACRKRWTLVLTLLGLAGCSDKQELVSPTGQYSPSMDLTSSAGRLAVARDAIDRASGPRGRGDIAVSLKSAARGGPELARTPASARREALSAVLEAFPGVVVRKGADRVVSGAIRQGDQIFSYADTITNSFITIEPPDEAVLAAMLTHPSVEFITPMVASEASLMNSSLSPAQASDPEIGWHLDSISVQDDWQNVGSNLADLVTFDTGFDPDHPDRPSNCPGVGGMNCLWFTFMNFTDHHIDNPCPLPEDILDYSDPLTDCWWEDPLHGTGVASTAVGPKNFSYSSGVGGHVGGVTTGRGIIVLKVGYEDPFGTFQLWEDDFATAVQWVIDNQDACLFMPLGCHQLNIRVGVAAAGWPGNPGSFGLLQGRFQSLAVQDKVLVFASAGENNQAAVPAQFQQVVAVGALNQGSLNPRPGSPQGPFLELTAPGQSIFTNYNNTGGSAPTRFTNGASPAAGIVAGAAWFFLLSNEGSYPLASWLRNEMRRTARTDIIGGFPPDPAYGYGMIDLHCLMEGLGSCAGPAGAPPAPPQAQISGPNEGRPYESCSWVGTASGGGGGPYEYDWYWDGGWFASGPIAWKSVGSAGYHELKLVVTEGGQTDTDVSWFNVDYGAEECWF